MITIDDIKQNINTEITIKEKRPNIYQIFAPIFHEDGDMVEIFVENVGDKLRLCDYGLTTMKLSYYLDNLNNTNQKVYNEILKENLLDEENGNIFIQTDLTNLNSNFLHYAHSLSKISSLKYFDRHKRKSVFYEVLSELIEKDFQDIKLEKDYIPVKSQPDNKVDYAFLSGNRPVYLFGVKDNTKALQVVTSCLEFKQGGSKHRSIIVYDDFNNLSKDTVAKLIRNTDKPFLDLSQFESEGKDYILEEVA